MYMCCVYLKICIWYTTIPKHAKYQAQKLLVECKTTPWRTDLIPSALQWHPTVHKFPLPESLPVREAKIKTVRINVSVILRWTNPSTCELSWQGVKTQMSDQVIQSYWNQISFESTFLGQFSRRIPETRPFYQSRASFKYVSIPTTSGGLSLVGESKDVLIIDSLGSCNVYITSPKNALWLYKGKSSKLFFDTFALFNLRKTWNILWNPWFLLSFPIRAKLVTEAFLTTILWSQTVWSRYLHPVNPKPNPHMIFPTSFLVG